MFLPHGWALSRPVGLPWFYMVVTQPQDTRQALLDSAQQTMSRKGFAAVGINEVLQQAGVPKGSFYHYFSSKDAFGEAMMVRYFVEYRADMDRIFADTGLTAGERILRYFDGWREQQSVEDCQGKCLAVKLGAEVADLSESMRQELKQGINSIVDRLERMIGVGHQDGSIRTRAGARATAETLYDVWLGASIVAKINRASQPLESATLATRHLLDL